MISRFDLEFSLSRIISDYRFSFTVIFTMALGLALSLFLFLQVYSMGYKSLPFKDGDVIVSIARKEAQFSPPIGGLHHYEIKYFLDNQSTLERYSVFEIGHSVTVSTDSFTENFSGAWVAGEFFELLGVEPQLGRTLTGEDFIENGPNNVVISDKMWNKLYQRDPEVLGKRVTIGGWEHTIVGVMPPGFSFPISQDLWARFNSMNVTVPNGAGWLTALGKLKAGVSQQQAESDFQNLSAEIVKRYPTEFKGKSVHLNTMPGAFAENNKLVISSMLIVAVAILVMGCASISNLLVVRMLEQRKDTMVKLAVGLPFWRVATVPILESLWLCLVSGILGMALCVLAIKLVGQHAFSALGPFWWDVEIGMPFWIAGGAFIATIWLVTGSLPVIMSLKTPTNSALAGGRKGGASNKSGKFMNILISAQVACAFLLMTITGLATYNFVKTLSADYGINPENYLTAALKPSSATYPEIQDRVNYYRKIEQQFLTLPEVESVSFSGVLPSQFSNNGITYSPVNTDLSSATELPRAGSISIDYKALSGLGIEIIEGRHFNEFDTGDSERVIIINEKLAKDLWPDDSAVGKQLQIDPDKRGPVATIVGVADEVIFGYPSGPVAAWPVFYQPMTQILPLWAGMHVAVKVRGDMQALIPKLKDAARKVDAQVPLVDIVPFEERMDRNANGVKKLIYNFLPAAVLALIMAAIGIYGISARLVLQKTSDIGVMMALGAKDAHITKLFLSKSLWQLLGGILPGILILFVMLPQLLEQLEMSKALFIGVSSVVVLVVGSIVLFASYIPLHRAIKLTPQVALNGGQTPD